MYCFNCGQTMQILNRHGVMFEHCYGCGSYWFDRGELETVLKGGGVALDERTLGGRPRMAQSCRWCGGSFGPAVVDCPDCQRPLGYRCPRDETPMAIIEAFGIELDHCTQCGGLWFDGREFKALVDAARAAQPVQWDEAAAKADRCQICGANEGMLLMQGGLLRCDRCRKGPGEEDEAEKARIKEEYYRHWRRQEGQDRFTEEYVHSMRDPVHPWNLFGSRFMVFDAIRRFFSG